MPRQDEITRLLEAAGGGDSAALDRLFPIVYDQLRRMADRRLRAERAGHTLNPTGLVHEAYLKLGRLDRIDWKSRGHFYAIAARAMRNILVDYAIRRKAGKRGGDRQQVELDEAHLIAGEKADELLALHQALERLEALDPRQGQVVEYRFFGDLTIEETAQAMGLSPATVNREWAMARAWLSRELGAEPR
jgi:RNA polymerase sigma factor (TIGR02999 family)